MGLIREDLSKMKFSNADYFHTTFWMLGTLFNGEIDIAEYDGGGESMDFNLIQDGSERGDCTASYKVIIRGSGTVNDFVDAVINNHPRDWGYIGIKAKGHIFGNPNMEYSRGKTTNREALEAFKDCPIKNVSADGGWSRMDYLIET